MNRNLVGYRNMLALTQVDMALKLNICRESYVNKEKGKKDFTQTEIETIMKILKEQKPQLTVEEVFLRSWSTKRKLN